MAVSQATNTDLASRALRTLTSAEITWGQVRLRDAFTQIVTQVPGAPARLDAGVVTDPFNQLVIQVQCAMVLRVLANPDGILEETVDDYTRRLDGTVSTGGLYLTAAELALLTMWNAGSEGAFSIRPLAVPDSILALPIPGVW